MQCSSEYEWKSAVAGQIGLGGLPWPTCMECYGCYLLLRSLWDVGGDGAGVIGVSFTDVTKPSCYANIASRWLEEQHGDDT